MTTSAGWLGAQPVRAAVKPIAVCIATHEQLITRGPCTCDAWCCGGRGIAAPRIAPSCVCMMSGNLQQPDRSCVSYAPAVCITDPPHSALGPECVMMSAHDEEATQQRVSTMPETRAQDACIRVMTARRLAPMGETHHTQNLGLDDQQKGSD